MIAKYRGKQLDGGDWVHGYYIVQPTTMGNKTHIIYDGEYEHSVDPNTVGQYTGLPDNKDKHIWQGDRFRRGTDEGTVVFERGAFWVMWDEPHSWQIDRILHRVHSEGDVVGSIHDHPHLLEGTASTLAAGLRAISIGPDRADIVAGYGTNEELAAWYRTETGISEEEWADYVVKEIPLDKNLNWDGMGEMTIRKLVEGETNFPQIVGYSE